MTDETQKNQGSDSDSSPPPDDDWGFLASRKEQAQPVEKPVKRAAGEFRGEMAGGVSLKRRAWPMALSLALVSVAGFLTEAVGATQIVSLAGPTVLFIVYPLGGVGLLLFALLQFKFVDAHARLKVIRISMLLYAVLFIVALIFLGAGTAQVVATSVIYLLGDQMNFLIPLLIWSLAGDMFNVAEGRKIFGWIVAFTYGGQILGLVIATFSPPIFDAIDVPLPALLVIDPVICLAIGIWLPMMLRGSSAALGGSKAESLKQAVGGAFEFINGVPVWRTFLFGSIITFAGGMIVFLAFLVGQEEVIGKDAGQLQMFFGGVMLGSLIICLLLQFLVAEKIQEKIGIPGALMILPISTVLGGVLLVFGILAQSLPLLAVGLAAWFIPRWSLDENARRGALALVPDERRTRVSFLVDLAPISIGLLIAGPLAALALAVGQAWAIPAVGVLISIIAIPFAIKVRRDWEESLLNWRLRRRKRNRSSFIDLIDEPD
ncbi:MAG: hypothetical protein K0U30_09785 [Actinomycetia bacterium]|nr:hypothetical protein [Actinomycetes bacterium]